MTAELALGCFGAGFAVAWIFRTAFKMAETSWWQGRMQTKVSYWQGQALHARDVAELFMGRLATATGQEPAVPDWPRARLGPEEEW